MCNTQYVFPVNIVGNLLSSAEVVRNIGVWFDLVVSFPCHVRNTCKACFISGILSNSEGTSSVMLLFWL